MRFLLDTHAFLWWESDDRRLSVTARRIFSDEDNEIFFSVASGWEIAIKAGLGQLDIPEGPERFVLDEVEANDFIVLSVDLRHALGVYDLPDHHRDPFDRLLVAQAQAEDFPILTMDPEISRYPVETVW
ncbi:MAG: type II toxin-antitoxin system VapC family toxin [Rubrobacteraceae bacterium]